MKALVIATPRGTAPPEVIPTLIDAAEAWQRRHEDEVDAFGLFPGGGGFAVADVADEAELHRITAEMPFSPFSDVQVRVFVDGPTGWSQVREAYAAMLASA